MPSSGNRVGLDVVDVARFRKVLERRPGVVLKLFTEHERKYCDGAADTAVHLAARFAVKEAVRKALGRTCRWHAVEVRNETSGAPVLALDPALLTWDGRAVRTASVSISHDGGMASAVVMLGTEAQGDGGHVAGGDAPAGVRGDKPADGRRAIDESHMRRALDLAEHGRGFTSPNPRVGAVVVAPDGTVLGEGWHRRAGLPHAEREALDGVGPAAAGATMYVTLEPCGHHGRTPPCVDGILDAGISRVVVAQEDPDARMAGKSIARLRAAGVQVDVGVLRSRAERELAEYRHHRSTGRPLVVLKLAVTVDGRVAAPDGTSQWITGPEAREDAHRLRHDSDAIVVGSGTALEDDPRLTVRLAEAGLEHFTQPVRVLLDSRGRVPPDASVFDGDGDVIVATVDAPEERMRAWRGAGASVLHPGATAEGRIDLDALLDDLGSRGHLQVLVEGGAAIAGALARQRLWDRLVVYVGAALAGGDDALPALTGAARSSITAFDRLELLDVERLGPDVRLTYAPAGAIRGSDATDGGRSGDGSPGGFPGGSSTDGPR